MRANAMVTGYQVAVVCADYPFSDRDWHLEADADTRRKSYIEARFLDTDHRFEIVGITGIMQRSDITKYTGITRCAFITVEGKSVLAIELRDENNRSEDAVIVVARVCSEGSETRLGFIVSDCEEFLMHVE